MENTRSGPESLSAHSMVAAWLIAAAAVALQMLTNGRYGYFRDELYFMATGDHLGWGYVDFAPLSALIIHVSRALFGSSLHAIRFLPALANGAQILLTGLITRELGGRRFAIILACLSVFLAPVILNQATRFSMNPFEPLFWMGCIYFLLLSLDRNRPELLVWCGVMLGVGLENKHSTVFFLLSLTVGLLISPQRKLLASKWFWIAAAVALALALPNLLWQVHNHFPTWVDLSNVKRTHKNVELPPLPFLKQQILMLGPTGAIIWIAGIGFLLFHAQAKHYRFLGVTYVLFLGTMMALYAKDYYLAPIYPMLFAAGGVFWETLSDSRRGLRWLRIALPALVLLLGLVTVPLVVPILPVEKIQPYMSALGLKMSRDETNHSGPLPQHFGDEFSWPEMVEAVAHVYNTMPPEERAQTAILAGNYGEAGAIDFFGGQYGLPKSISAHQNYYLWGPRQYTGKNVILLQWDLSDAKDWCRSVDIGPALDPPYAMMEEHFSILTCHGFKMPLSEAWPHLKHWN